MGSNIQKLHDTIIWYRCNQQPANTDRCLTGQYEFLFHLRHTGAEVQLNKETAKAHYPDVFDRSFTGIEWKD